MAATNGKTVTSILAGYFNVDDGKRPLREFQGELKALTTEEKLELAQGVCAITGDAIKE
jgi:hypothetical protein